MHASLVMMASWTLLPLYASVSLLVQEDLEPALRWTPWVANPAPCVGARALPGPAQGVHFPLGKLRHRDEERAILDSRKVQAARLPVHASRPGRLPAIPVEGLRPRSAQGPEPGRISPGAAPHSRAGRGARATPPVPEPARAPACPGAPAAARRPRLPAPPPPRRLPPPRAAGPRRARLATERRAHLHHVPPSSGLARLPAAIGHREDQPPGCREHSCAWPACAPDPELGSVPAPATIAAPRHQEEPRGPERPVRARAPAAAPSAPARRSWAPALCSEQLFLLSSGCCLSCGS